LHGDIFFHGGLDGAHADAFALPAPIPSFHQNRHSAQKSVADATASAISSREAVRVRTTNLENNKNKGEK